MLSKMNDLRLRFLVKSRIRPLERFTKDIQWVGNFNAPEAYYDFYFVDRQFGIVGELSGGMSPLQDTFYLFKIQVPLKFKRDHYELSMLANIAEFYNVPITPMHDIDAKLLESMRRNSHGTFQLAERISAEGIMAELRKWSRMEKNLEAMPE